MTISRIEKKPRMSNAVVHNGVAYLSGIVGRNGSCVTEQTKDALSEVDRLLATVGSDKSQLLSATIWLADISDFDAMNAVWDDWVDADNPPARATGQVPLAREKYRVEVVVTAAVP
ncbi:MAG: RidA family protein [Rhizobiaceae bacterium]|jgi:enamine deaminase RidA (YjgF/YER057c/UK114 family)|nr:RidA family protein [Rhizobiaceae bacterium]MBO6727587.1 RidA family protein [Rhizobiaceae bacterium]